MIRWVATVGGYMSGDICPLAKRAKEVFMPATCEYEKGRFCPYLYYAKSYRNCPLYVKWLTGLKRSAGTR